MHKTIWKFRLETRGPFTLGIPRAGNVVHVDMWQREPCMWVLVNPDLPLEERNFELFWTGNAIPMAAKYIGTYKQGEHKLVWHLFEHI